MDFYLAEALKELGERNTQASPCFLSHNNPYFLLSKIVRQYYGGAAEGNSPSTKKQTSRKILLLINTVAKLGS